MRSSPGRALPTGADAKRTRMSLVLISHHCRSSVREEYMPAMRLALTAPMWGAASGGREKDGIAQVMELMDDYSLTRCALASMPFLRCKLTVNALFSGDWEALLEMTKIKVRWPRAHKSRARWRL